MPVLIVNDVWACVYICHCLFPDCLYALLSKNMQPAYTVVGFAAFQAARHERCVISYIECISVWVHGESFSFFLFFLCENSIVVVAKTVEWSRFENFAPLVGHQIIKDHRCSQYEINGLESSCKYYVQVSAGNIKGFGPPCSTMIGIPSSEISFISHYITFSFCDNYLFRFCEKSTEQRYGHLNSLYRLEGTFYTVYADV